MSGSIVVGARLATPAAAPLQEMAASAASTTASAARPGVARATSAAGSPAATGAAASRASGGLARGAATAQGRSPASQLGGILTGLVRSNLGGALPAGSGALAFLKDPRLSVEEKLARLMVHLSDKYEKQLNEKLNAFAAAEGGTAARTSSKPGGLAALGEGIGKLVSGKAGVGDVVPALVGQLAGPVLAGAATALGMPALAPAILRAGPLIGGAVAGVTGRGAAASGAGSASAPSEKQLMTEIQILQEKQKEMFTLVSNILRSLHDTKMGVIGNIR